MRTQIHFTVFPILLTLAALLPGEQAAAVENESTKQGAPALATTTSPSDYRIGVGDVLQIQVWKEPEASVPAVVVRSDGKISAPLIKEIYVEGLTPTELERLLTERLARLVRDVDVTVLVKDIHSKKIYIIGAVKHEGPIDLKRPLTVLQAVAEAGGFTDYAKPRKLYILRRESGKQVRLPYDYIAAIRGEGNQTEIILQPDDTLVVPR